MKILDFFRIQVGIRQYWPKFQLWESQGWLFLPTQTMLVTKFCQKYSFDKQEELLGYILCSSFLASFVMMVSILLYKLNRNKP